MEEEALWQEQVVTWSCQLVDALESLHQQGIVCGDLNPSNLLLDDDGEFSFDIVLIGASVISTLFSA